MSFYDPWSSAITTPSQEYKGFSFDDRWAYDLMTGSDNKASKKKEKKDAKKKKNKKKAKKMEKKKDTQKLTK